MKRLPEAARALAAGLAAALCTFGAAAQEGPCADTVAQLRLLAQDAQFPLRWSETSMTDERPLVVTITEREGALHLEFHKTQQGLWAEGQAQVCGAGGQLQARIAKSRIRPGPAAHWILRNSLAQGATFSLNRQASGQLRIATPGWSGMFAPLLP
ncbi:MAG TPA: hypothetical protein VLJ58_06055 [Ramlibacter sp.]|nr:hypothetical protein [Ramlibacter sp.]